MLNAKAGPAGVPVVSGNDVLVTYCIYGVNIPVSGTLSFELSNPQTGVVTNVCSYDASCNGGCATVSNPVVLPLAFTDYVISQKNNIPEIHWRYGMETNMNGFEVERSSDGISFIKIGFVPFIKVSGNNTAAYSYTDKTVSGSGTFYYRLKINYADAAFYYSPVRMLKTAGPDANVQIAVKDNAIVISQPGAVHHIQVTVYNAQGQVVHKALVDQQQYIINDMKRGVYYISARPDQEAVIKKTINIF